MIFMRSILSSGKYPPIFAISPTTSLINSKGAVPRRAASRIFPRVKGTKCLLFSCQHHGQFSRRCAGLNQQGLHGGFWRVNCHAGLTAGIPACIDSITYGA